MDRTIKSTRKSNTNNIYNTALINKKINIPVIYVGDNLVATILEYIKYEYEDRCIVEGYIKPNTVEIINYSCGLCISDSIIFDITFKCSICNPVEGMAISCIANNITKAGIKASLKDDTAPLIIFIARDHHSSKYFNSIAQGDEIQIKVIGQRYELNDTHISVIAELVEKPQIIFGNNKSKPKINIQK